MSLLVGLELSSNFRAFLGPEARLASAKRDNGGEEGAAGDRADEAGRGGGRRGGRRRRSRRFRRQGGSDRALRANRAGEPGILGRRSDQVVDTARAPAPTAARSRVAPAWSDPCLVGEHRAGRRGERAMNTFTLASIRLSPIARRPNTSVSTIMNSASPAAFWTLEPPLEPRPIEHECLLRQPEEPRAGRKRKSGRDGGGGAVAAIDALGRRRGRFDLGCLRSA